MIDCRQIDPNDYAWAIRNEGAFIAFISVNNALEGAHIAQTKKQYAKFVNSLVGMLLEDYRARDVFLDCMGVCDIVVDSDTCEVREICAPHGQGESE